MIRMRITGGNALGAFGDVGRKLHAEQHNTKPRERKQGSSATGYRRTLEASAVRISGESWADSSHALAPVVSLRDQRR